MDLETIENKLKNDFYESEQQVKENLNKIWENAQLYNPQESVYHKMAKEMQKFCLSLFKPKEESLKTKSPLLFDKKQLKQSLLKVPHKEQRKIMSQLFLEGEKIDVDVLSNAQLEQLDKLIRKKVSFEEEGSVKEWNDPPSWEEEDDNEFGESESSFISGY